MKKKTKKASPVVANALISNGLSEAILGFEPGGIGTQLQQVDTLFVNERWYLLSNMRPLLSQMYVEHGLIRTVVRVPVDDAFRGGIEIKTKQLSPEQIQELQADSDREGVLVTMADGMTWSRLFGGGAVIIMTDQDPATPLDLAAIRPDSPLVYRDVDMWELFFDQQNTEELDPSRLLEDVEFYNYYGVKLHKSRVLRFKGLKPPSFIRPRLRGWGFSIVETLVQSINQYLKSNNLIFEVLDEFKLDIFKIKGLSASLLSAEGFNAIQKRVKIANLQKNFQNALSMDSEDDYIQKQLTFSGLAEMMKEFRIQIASDMRMPLTKLFGLSATGFSSGEDDIENYNSMVESEVRSKCKYELVKLLEIRCQKLFGMVPDDLSIDFRPLRILSSEQEETVKTQKMNRILAALAGGAIQLVEAKEAINKENLVGVQIDTSIEELPVKTEPDGNPADEGAALQKKE